MAEDLKDYYLNSLCKKPIYPWKTGNYVDLDTLYVPLTIDINLPGIRPIKERLKSYTEIFSSKDESTRYLLTGSPGQGKSTFCAKLAFDWCNDVAALSNVKLLIILQLATVNHLSNIDDVICSQLLSSNLDTEIVHKVIKKMGKNVVIVLDGLDEAPTDLFQHETNGDLVKTIQFKHLRHCRVLITTRPWREREITGNFPEYRRLQLRRMTKADVNTYIGKLFNHNLDDLTAVALGRRLLKYINENKVLVDVSIPLMVLLISWYWIKTNGQKSIPERTGDLYGEIINIMLQESSQLSGKQTVSIIFKNRFCFKLISKSL